jgi:phospholipid N-methyltransferase
MLLRRLSNRGRLLAMEISETNIDVLRRSFPRCRTIHDSAENLPQHLGSKKADCIISGLAWGNMLPVAQDRILTAFSNHTHSGRAICRICIRACLLAAHFGAVSSANPQRF